MRKALIVEHVSKTYKTGVVALKNLSFTIDRGDFFALLGRNGAGKSTLIGILTSLVLKDSGRVLILGKDIDQSPRLAKANLGIVPQEFDFNIFKTLTDVALDQAGFYNVPRKIARQRMDYYIERLGLSGKRNHRVMELSGGMKRRLMILRALLHEPEFLILDEPTAGVDVETRHLLWDFLSELNKAGRTILLTTHYIEEAERLCRNLAVIDEGKLLESGDIETVLARHGFAKEAKGAASRLEGLFLALTKPSSSGLTQGVTRDLGET